MQLPSQVWLFVCLSFHLTITAQSFFPVKVDQYWGLMDSDGHLVLPAEYQAIGEFKHFGFAVMQKDNQVGLLGPNGKEALSATYDDIKVLATDLVAVMNKKQWSVINLQGQTIVEGGYQRVNVLAEGLLAFREDGRWGIVDAKGRSIARPQYKHVERYDDHTIQVVTSEGKGLLDINGSVILPPIAQDFDIYQDSIVFYQKGRYWGAVRRNGEVLFVPEFSAYKVISPQFIKLFRDRKIEVFSLACERLLQPGHLDEVYAFTPRYLLTKRDRQLGLLSWCGQQTLSNQYEEIQTFGAHQFRVRQDGQWGVVDANNNSIIQTEFEYISPLQGPVCVVKQERGFGVLNYQGDTIVPTIYERIQLEQNQVKAFKAKAADGQEDLALFHFDDQGLLTNNSEFGQHFQIKIGGNNTSSIPLEGSSPNVYQLDRFEWFYDPETDHWGLRDISNGHLQIEPIFDYIQVEKELGYTLVGIWKSNDYEYERTSFRYQMIFGLVMNDLGILVTEMDFLDVRLEDLAAGLSSCRVIFSNGRHGLLDRAGRVIRKDLTYIGAFNDGLARVSFVGRLTGSRTEEQHLGRLQSFLQEVLSPVNMLDYTQYDQLFQEEANLYCKDCEWGYIDPSGEVQVTPAYTFAQPMTNGAGFVECEGKWGMVSKHGNELIPCQYDGIEFLERTGNKMVRVYVKEPKYGLIDTLGQLAVNAIYEEIGSFAEGRLAVSKNNLWGFVDKNGFEIIPCRFQAVNNFSEGKATVKLGNRWGVIDLQGEKLIDFTYPSLGNFKNGLAWAESKKRFGYIDESEDFVIPPQFSAAHDFEQSIARVLQDGTYGLIDIKGDFVLKPRYLKIAQFNQHGLAQVQYGREHIRYGLIDMEGHRITSADYRKIDDFQEGLALVQGKQGFGYIDIHGRQVITPQFTRAEAFQDGRAIIYRKGECGYIDREGKAVIPCQFSRCQEFRDGKAVVYEGIRKAGLIDTNGQFLVQPSLDRLLNFQEGRGLMRDANYRFYYITEQTNLYDGYYEQASAFEHGVAVVRINGKWGIINQKGIEIIPPKYDHITDFEDGFAKVRIEGYNGLSTLEGKLIVQPNYEFIHYAGDGLFRVEQGDKIGYFDQEGDWVWRLD